MLEKRKRLVIIDGKSVFYRGYFAMPSLSTKDGTPTGGVYGFAVMALEVIKRLKPDYVCVAWDKPKTNIRKRLEIYPEYKAGRKPSPPDFIVQIPLLHKLLNAFGWPLYELDDYEADDILGTLATQAKAKGLETLLVTSDLDVLQLINSHTRAYLLKTGLSNIELLNPESFEQKYGITADQFLDFKSLAGDSSDNIPGAPGIGKKTAIDLLKEFGTIDNIYENLAKIKPSIRTKLESGRELVKISKKLAKIWTDAPLELDLKEVDGSKANPLEIQKQLRELEFRTLIPRIPEIFRVNSDEVPTVNHELKIAPNTVIDTDDKLLKIEIDKTDEIVIHGRVGGKHGSSPKYLIISTSPKKVITVFLEKVKSKLLSDKLEKLLSENKIQKVGYDLKSIIKLCNNQGLELSKIDHDVLIASFLINPLQRALTITELAQNELGYEGASLENLDDEEFVNHASDIIAIIRSIYELQKKKFNEVPRLEKLARQIEWPVIPVLARMELIGIKLDTDYLNNMSEKLADKISDIEQEIYGHADMEFNINSPSQLGEVLFGKLQLGTLGIKRGKTGYSTAASELDKLRGLHPIVDLISEYRELTKLKSTYIDTLPLLVDGESRLHTTFNLTIAQTGRLSSNDPNLQNIPVRTEIGRDIRRAFIADPGNVLISADYSQFELRLAAFLANDVELIEQFNKDMDIHTITAAEVYGRSPEDVTKDMRRDAKVINFGILYGMSPHGLSVATGMTQSAAKAFIEKYFEHRQPLLAYMNDLKRKAKEDGYVEDLFGRRRPMPDINSSNFIVRQAAERAAINMPIQGTEADLMKLAMIKLDEKLKKYNCNMLLQIHDSILVECSKKSAEEVEKVMKQTMENVYPLSVKLTVETKKGSNWAEL